MSMVRDFSTRFVAWSFVAAAVMLWGGWILMPTRIGMFFEPDDFAHIHASYHMSLYMPVFHVKSAWLLVTGGVILRRGLNVGAPSGVGGS